MNKTLACLLIGALASCATVSSKPNTKTSQNLFTYHGCEPIHNEKRADLVQRCNVEVRRGLLDSSKKIVLNLDGVSYEMRPYKRENHDDGSYSWVGEVFMPELHIYESVIFIIDDKSVTGYIPIISKKHPFRYQIGAFEGNDYSVLFKIDPSKRIIPDHPPED